MYCPNCGSNIVDGASFCPNCGTAINNNTQAQETQNNQYQDPYNNQYQQDQYQAQQYNQYNNQYSGQPYHTYSANLAMPMKWFKFLIYFSLFASAATNFINAFPYFTGSMYGEDAEMIYIFFPEIQVLNIITGIISLCIAALAIFTRFQLAGFKKNGPNLISVLYVITIVVNVGYIVALGAILGFDKLAPNNFVSLFAVIITSVVMIIVNRIYFNKRKFMFVN